MQARLTSGRVAAGLVCALTVSCQHTTTVLLGPDPAGHGGPRPPSAAPLEPVAGTPTPSPSALPSAAPTLARSLRPPMPALSLRPAPHREGYLPPTITATRFVGCPRTGHSDNYTFTAEIDLHGGAYWKSRFSNLTRKSGDTWQWSMTNISNAEDDPPSPAPGQKVVWDSLEVYDVEPFVPDGGDPRIVAFPAAMVIRATCPG